VQVKDTLRGTFGFFADTSNSKKLRNYIDGDYPVLLVLCLGLIICASLVLFCGVSAGCLLAVREKSRTRAANGRNPYSTTVPKCAKCAWCCGFFFSIFALFVSGLMVTVGTPLSGLCLVLDDLNGALLHDIAPAVGLNLTGDRGAMTVDVIDQCFNPSNASNPGYLLDIVFVTENGTKVTMREKVVNQMKGQIAAKFAFISEKLDASGVSLADSAKVNELRQAMRLNAVDEMMLAVPNLNTVSRFEDLALASELVVGYSISAACGDLTVSSGMGDFSGKTITGISDFVSRLRDFGVEVNGTGVEVNSTDCTRTVICTDAPGSDSGRACVAGNALVELKREVRSAGTYKCDLFEDPSDPSGPACDPLRMSHNGTTWVDDCAKLDGTMTLKPRSCDLAEFQQYARDFDERVRLIFKRLDFAVEEASNHIDTRLRGLMEEHVLGPIDRIADGATCGFLAGYYQNMIDGFCYQGVVGMRYITGSYIVCAVAIVVLIIVNYLIWSRTSDNVLAWAPEEALFPRHVCFGEEEAGPLKVDDGIEDGKSARSARSLASPRSVRSLGLASPRSVRSLKSGATVATGQTLTM